MEKLFYDISEVLGVTILHSLWQGLIIYSLVRLALTSFPSVSSALKYQMLYLSLAGLTLWFGCTFFTEARNYQWSALQVSDYAPVFYQHAAAANLSNPVQVTGPGFRDSATHLIKAYLPYLSAIYLAVLFINIVRFGLSWKKVGIVKNEVEPDNQWQEKAERFAEQLAITRYVQLGISKVVDGPCTVGYLKPVILMPVAFTTQLSTQEVEAILLHELAHIKNNDYLYNIIQQMMMVVVLFLNPFALMISRMIGGERENRCDDMVVAMTENPMPYARALLKLEEISLTHTPLALSAIGQKYQLLGRIERIIKRKKPIINVRHLLAILLLFIFSVSSLAWLNPEIKNGKLVSVRGAKAINKLVAVVKSVITKNDAPVVAAKPAAIVVKPDSSQTIGSQNQDDTTLTAKRRVELLDEFRRVSKSLDQDREIIKNLPEQIEVRAAVKILDSVTRIMVKESVTPDLVQQQKEKTALMDKYLNSPEVKQKQAVSRAAVEKFIRVLNNQPEMTKFNENYNRQLDSIYTVLQQRTGLTKSEVSKTPDFELWTKTQNIANDALHLKLLEVPEVRAAIDTMEMTRNAVYGTPEFKTINEQTKASPEYMAAISPAALGPYRKALI